MRLMGSSKRRLGRPDAGSSVASAVQPSAVRFEGVSLAFKGLSVLEELSLEVEAGSCASIIGPSGCGKSTLLLAAAGLITPNTGSISIGDATTPAERLASCAMMPQQDLLLPWRTALDNACIALENRGFSKAAARDRTRPHFAQFGLGSFEQSLPSQLSGGMRQRVSFLRTLMAEKGVLLLDEPFGALDAITRAQMQDWLITALRGFPMTTILVTHDVEEALLLADRVVVLSPRPAHIVTSLEVTVSKQRPRSEIVSDPAFVNLKHLALDAIA